MPKMEFEAYIKSMPVKLSDVKLIILRALWDSGSTFPRPWVRSSTLLKLTDQKYFDRRTRELRDQVGCDIENQYQQGEHCYRLNSANLNQYNPREYLSQSQKNQLFSSQGGTCQICGSKMQAGARGLQADHKVPLNRGGSNDVANWQSLCNECNVAKRRACADCNEVCKQCTWAFPEHMGARTLVVLPHGLIGELQKRGINTPKRIEETIVATMANAFQVKP